MNLLAEGLKQICAADKTAACIIEPRLTEITGLLCRYMDEIEHFNSAYGLVKADSRDILIVKHILDSLTAIGHIARLLGVDPSLKDGTALPAEKTLADLGSGAGLPGIPLAICMPWVNITLIERMGRRAGFLRNVCAVLSAAVPGSGLADVVVEETGLENVRSRFDMVTLRALGVLTPSFAEKLIRLVKKPSPYTEGTIPKGVIAAYKGIPAKAAAELESLAAYTTALFPLNVPFLDEQRCLAVIKQ